MDEIVLIESLLKGACIMMGTFYTLYNNQGHNTSLTYVTTKRTASYVTVKNLNNNQVEQIPTKDFDGWIKEGTLRVDA
jgi:hypothetical protein